MKKLIYFVITILFISILPEIASAQSYDTYEQQPLKARDMTPKREKRINRKSEVKETVPAQTVTSQTQITDKKQVEQSSDVDNTSLEQTIVRWDIQSRPQGADIFWRVVSKTPEVKSTNNNYLMTTPNEATRALDIKGLTNQNASNVRIILRCEKDGYLPQEKEFNVRMVMDQEEISAFFRLVKDE